MCCFRCQRSDWTTDNGHSVLVYYYLLILRSNESLACLWFTISHFPNLIDECLYRIPNDERQLCTNLVYTSLNIWWSKSKMEAQFLLMFSSVNPTGFSRHINFRVSNSRLLMWFDRMRNTHRERERQSIQWKQNSWYNVISFPSNVLLAWSAL